MFTGRFRDEVWEQQVRRGEVLLTNFAMEKILSVD